MNVSPRHPLRSLARSPGFTVVAVLMLALGIGMSTSTFSVTNAVLLRALPFPEPDQLVRVFRTTAESDSLAHSPGNFLDLKASATAFTSMAAYFPLSGNLAEPGHPPDQAYGLQVTAGFLPTLGLQPMLGRSFAPDQDKPGKSDVMLLSHAFWQRRFAGDPAVLGRTLRVGMDNLTVIGVLPPSFDHTLLWSGVDYLRPETIWGNFASIRGAKWYDIIARLKPGVSLSSAQPEMNTLATRLARDFPADNALDRLRLTPLGASFVAGHSRQLYWLVTGLALSVLVIACANLAALQLARAFRRSHEFAIRAALGASRVDLMLPLLVESLLLALGGGLLGLLLAAWANSLVRHLIAGDMAIPLDTRVLAFAGLAALLTGLTFGLAPAWLASRVTTGEALKSSTRGGTTSRRQSRLKHILVSCQMAFALVLVCAAATFGFAVKRSLHRDLGWRPTGLVSGVCVLPYATYKADEKKFVFVRDLRERLRQLPGITAVTIATQVPHYGYAGEDRATIEGAVPVPAGHEPKVLISGIDADFLPLLSLPLKAGRALPANPSPSDPAFVLINETMARQLWPRGDALGQRLRFANTPERTSEIIGIVGDVQMNAGFAPPVSRFRVYCASVHAPSGNGVYSFVLQTTLPAAALEKPVRATVAALDADVLVHQFGGVTQTLERFLAGHNLMIVTLSAFASVGLLIALIGLSGVMTQLMQQRSREIGIRLALGAGRRDVLTLILTHGARLLVAGILPGLLGVWAVNRLYHQTMPELPLPGLAWQLAIAALLGLIGLAACYLPARRATRIDPAIVLRAD